LQVHNSCKKFSIELVIIGCWKKKFKGYNFILKSFPNENVCIRIMSLQVHNSCKKFSIKACDNRTKLKVFKLFVIFF
jgi:azurin